MPRTARRVLALLIIGLTAAGVLAARRLAAERAPRHGLNGSGRVLGSLDTWPPVRRAPERPPAGA